MLISIDKLQPDRTPVRRRQSADDDQVLRTSMAALGQLDPVLVVRLGDDLDEDPAYEVKDGNRRLAAARALGIAHLEATLLARSRPEFTVAAATAANTVRAPLPPVDQWRAVQAMLEHGHTLPSAASALGLSERRTAQLERLSRLHPKLLEALEAGNFPTDHTLREIAAAPPELQLKALSAKGNVTKDDGGVRIFWSAVAEACRRQRFPRAAALFDTTTGAVAFDQDLFAQPGSEEEWTTTNVSGFLAAQRQALEAQAAASGGKLHAVPESTREPGNPQLPSGWRQNYGKPDKPTKAEFVFACVSGRTGTVVRVTAIDTAAERARKAKADAKAAARAAADQAPPATPATPPGAAPAQPNTAPDARPNAPDDAPDDDAADTDDSGASIPPVIAPTALTKSAAQCLADLKTAGLRARLRDPTAPIDAETVIAMLVLTLQAPNVTVQGYAPPAAATSDSTPAATMQQAQAALAARLVTPTGLLHWDSAELLMVAREALAQVLSFDGIEIGYNPYKRRSGAVAEWIAAGIDVAPGRHLPRLDIAELLAGCDAATLKAAAASASVKFTTASAAKRELVGKLDGWRPPFAHFGAPGPRPPKPEIR